MAPRIVVLPNVVRDAVAPNTLSGLTGAPAAAPRAPVALVTGRRLWGIALFAGLGLALVLTAMGGRPW